jgi:uncharacterized membrane protein YfcA
MTPGDIGLLVGAAFGAGALNSIAGGGSFISFPALVFAGVPSIPANATSTVALWPGAIAAGFGFREELMMERKRLLSLAFISMIGGLLGAMLLLLTPAKTFDVMVPFLLLLATLVFTFGDRMRSKLRAGRSTTFFALQALIAIYGGFFGGGMSLMMLAAFTVAGIKDIHRMNALKSALGVLINGVAVVTFVVAGIVDWLPAGIMVAGSIAGGFLGAVVSKQFEPKKVKPVVIALGWVLTAVFFYRTFR